jgi:hypothetical protein
MLIERDPSCSPLPDLGGDLSAILYKTQEVEVEA